MLIFLIAGLQLMLVTYFFDWLKSCMEANERPTAGQLGVCAAALLASLLAPIIALIYCKP